MRNKTEYTDLPPGDEAIGELEVVEDFLPPPEKLVPREDNVKVTITLSRSSIEFFKQQAKKNNTQYQKMIRNLLDTYVERYKR